MNRAVWISLICLLVVIGMVFLILSKLNEKKAIPTVTLPIETTYQPKVKIALSSNKKEIVVGDKFLLEVNHTDIMNYFKAEGQLCDAYYLNRPERKAFCTDKNIFKQKTQFNVMDLSADKTAIGFSLTTEVMSPDALLGVFYPKRDDKKVHLISSYYLGNEFLGFSPDSKHFIFQHNCWEGFCGLTIKNTATLKTVLEINNPESIDERSDKTVFEKWIDNQTISYLINGEPAKFSF